MEGLAVWVLPWFFLQSEAGGGSEEGTSSGGAQCDGSEKGSSRIDEEEAELNLLADETSSSHTKADYTPAQSVSSFLSLRDWIMWYLKLSGFLSTFCDTLQLQTNGNSIAELRSKNIIFCAIKLNLLYGAYQDMK
jgi:hypothetical protein